MLTNRQIHHYLPVQHTTKKQKKKRWVQNQPEEGGKKKKKILSQNLVPAEIGRNILK